MARPRNCRYVERKPHVTYFKPRGIPMTELTETLLTVEGLEALRLADLEGQIASDRQELNQETVSKGSLEGRINVLNEQIHTEEMNEEHLESRRTVITGELEVRKGQLSSYEEEYGRMVSQVTDARERQEQAQARLNSQDELIRNLDESIEAAKGVIIQSLNEKASLTACRHAGADKPAAQ